MGVGDFFGTRAGDLINYAASKVLFASFFSLHASFAACPLLFLSRFLVHSLGVTFQAPQECVSRVPRTLYFPPPSKCSSKDDDDGSIFYTSAFELLRIFLFSSLYIFVASFTGLKCV